MSAALVAAVGRLGVHAIELAHAFREIGLRGFHDEMVMVGHQAIRMTAPVEALNHFAQHVDEGRSVGVVFHDRLAPIAAGGDVIEGVGEFDAQRSRHGVADTDFGEMLQCET